MLIRHRPCSCVRFLPLALIHPSAWNRYSRKLNFRFTDSQKLAFQKLAFCRLGGPSSSIHRHQLKQGRSMERVSGVRLLSSTRVKRENDGWNYRPWRVCK
jgi:hypothetical protein